MDVTKLESVIREHVGDVTFMEGRGSSFRVVVLLKQL